MPIQIIPAVTAPSTAPKASPQGVSPAKAGRAGKRFMVSKKLPTQLKPGFTTRAPNPKASGVLAAVVVPALSPVAGAPAKVPSPLKGQAPAKAMPQPKTPLATTSRPSVDPLGRTTMATPAPDVHPLPPARPQPIQPSKVALTNTKQVQGSRTLPAKPGATLKLGSAPAPSVENRTAVSNPAGVVIPSGTPTAPVRTDSGSVPSSVSPVAAPAVAKAPSPPRGWRIQPTTVRHQVGAVATRWKVSPPGRMRHSMEITVSNSGNSWQVEVKAHHQDGAWLSGALANTTALNQGFSQHGWDLSHVSLWLGQPSSGGNGAQYFGQSGHSPPEAHYGGYGSSGIRSETQSTVGSQSGINYTA